MVGLSHLERNATGLPGLGVGGSGLSDHCHGGVGILLSLFDGMALGYQFIVRIVLGCLVMVVVVMVLGCHVMLKMILFCMAIVVS